MLRKKEEVTEEGEGEGEEEERQKKRLGRKAAAEDSEGRGKR